MRVPLPPPEEGGVLPELLRGVRGREHRAGAGGSHRHRSRRPHEQIAEKEDLVEADGRVRHGTAPNRAPGDVSDFDFGFLSPPRETGRVLVRNGPYRREEVGI